MECWTEAVVRVYIRIDGQPGVFLKMLLGQMANGYMHWYTNNSRSRPTAMLLPPQESFPPRKIRPRVFQILYPD